MYFSIHPDCSDSATVIILYLGYGHLSRFKIKSAFARDCLEREFALRASLTKALLFLKEYLWTCLMICGEGGESRRWLQRFLPLSLITAVGAHSRLCGYCFRAVAALPGGGGSGVLPLGEHRYIPKTTTGATSRVVGLSQITMTTRSVVVY